MVWTTSEGVFVRSRDASRRIGASVVDEFAWSPGGHVAAGVVENPDSSGRQLVVWRPEGDAPAGIACARCRGAAIVGDEVRTAEGNVIHRFALADLSSRGDVRAVIPEPDPDFTSIPPSVVAATDDLTVVKHAPVVGPKGGPEFILAVDATGAVRWEHAVEGNLAITLTALDPAGELLAIPPGVQFDCAQVNTRLVVLELDTGRTAFLPDQPRPEAGHTAITDLWWNGTEIVVPTATTDPAAEADCDAPSTLRVSTLAGRQWREAPEGRAARAVRVLPNGDRVRLTADGTLELERDGSGQTVAAEVDRFWSPASPDTVPLW